MTSEAKRGGSSPRSNTTDRVMVLMTKLAIDKGLDALSMRDVAKRAGISLAALQYHFPSKDALIAAFVETKLENYRKDIDSLRRSPDPTAEMRNILVYAIDQTLDQQTDDIFSMLEARARHDRPTAVAMERFMRFYMETMRDVIARRRPDLRPRDAQTASVQIVAMIEGLSSVRSAAGASGFSEEDLRKAVVNAAEAVIEAPNRR